MSIALLLVGGGALAAATDGFRAFTTETARRLAARTDPIVVPDVALENEMGAQFTFTDLRGKWLLVDFIYTRCPTICGILGIEFAQLEQHLREPIAQGKVQLVSISFDPTRDSTAQLAAYLTRFRRQGPGWEAARPLTGDGLRQLTTAFGITAIPDRYGGFTHNASIHLVDPTGRLVEIFDFGDVERIRTTVLQKLQS